MKRLDFSGITNLEQVLQSYEGLNTLEDCLGKQLEKYIQLKASTHSQKEIESIEEMELEANTLLTKLPGWRWALCKQEMELRWAPGKSQVDW